MTKTREKLQSTDFTSVESNGALDRQTEFPSDTVDTDEADNSPGVSDTPKNAPEAPPPAEERAEEPAEEHEVTYVKNITAKSFGRIKKDFIPEKGAAAVVIGTIVGVIESVKEVPNVFNTERSQIKLIGVFAAVAPNGEVVQEASNCFLPEVGEDIIIKYLKDDGVKLPLEFGMTVLISYSDKSITGYSYSVRPIHKQKPPSRLKNLLQIVGKNQTPLLTKD